MFSNKTSQKKVRENGNQQMAHLFYNKSLRPDRMSSCKQLIHTNLCNHHINIHFRINQHPAPYKYRAANEHPRPTSTPVTPTATIPPSDVLAKYLENVRVVGYDNFNNPSGWSDTNEISNGVLKLTGFGGSDWHGLANNAFFQEDKGAVISFKFTPGAFFEMFFENGQWNTDQYIRFGVYVNHGSAQAQFFNQSKGVDPYELPGNLFLNAETWYSMFMVTGKNGDLLTVIWDPVRPNTHLRYRETVESLKGINWIFRTQVYEGTIIYDDFEEITFDEIK